MRALYACVSFVGNNRVVFNINGNHHRLIVALDDQLGVLYIKFIGAQQNSCRRRSSFSRECPTQVGKIYMASCSQLKPLPRN
ncbi:type II toxin-antitoxin system HigB family toxin [Undibacterium umbellatum]|uniref:Type II toxin-antitoxin system HigB family toxin n=1 Tax=Undibacterium umbellatum TaxID=2762300 RepID=A0ABR6ZC23_9BURK|nr:type II toxin-antitoxin system HigB family toxin [Undibacterium umbellatum]MBC3909304.1 type II toxin-antitoxin system HigB family toxin [Undibacterium umbellatum]